MRAARVALLSVVAGTAALAQTQEGWIGPARLWIDEIPGQLLEACLKQTGGSGIVEVRINAQGMVGLEALLGGAPVRKCVELVAARVGAGPISGGYSTRLYFYPSDAGSGRDANAELGRPRPVLPPFATCEGDQTCGAGQTCDRSVSDAGTCLDVVDLWRSRRNRVFGPRNADVVHLLPRTAAYCAGVGTSSDQVIVRVVDTSLRPVEARLTMVPFRWARDGGVSVRELLPPGKVGKGTGLSVDQPTLLAAQPEGCSSSSVVIAPAASACVLLVVSCPEATNP